MNAKIVYRIKPEPLSHQFKIKLSFQPTQQNTFELLSLPSWIPGSYMIREFARNIIAISAKQDKTALNLEKINKNTWRLYPIKQSVIEVEYQIYAWDLSVRTCYIDQFRGFFNATSICLKVHNPENQACELQILPPDNLHDIWKVATALFCTNNKNEPKFFKNSQDSLNFLAENYTELIDCPIEMGDITTAKFNACNTQHLIAVTGAYDDLDIERLCTDLAKVCEAQINLFEPEGYAPFSRYVFLIHATDNGYGGLEHKTSTALLCSRKDLPYKGMTKATEAYRNFLSLCSHEYFHAWNVKRIKPTCFKEPDLNQEVYTRQLWFFEGFTSYYDDLMLFRAGLLTKEQYANCLGKLYTNVMKNLGHTQQTVAESSFDTWIKYYRPDENSPNALVSYYAKGALIALCLDAKIRENSNHQKNLDNVMRWLWIHYGKTNKGLAENELPAAIESATNLDFRSWIYEATNNLHELPLNACLKILGFKLNPVVPTKPCEVGASFVASQEGLLVKFVRNHSAAESAGLSAGDIIVAIDEQRATQELFEQILTRKSPGETSRIVFFRKERLLNTSITWEKAYPKDWTIKPLN